MHDMTQSHGAGWPSGLIVYHMGFRSQGFVGLVHANVGVSADAQNLHVQTSVRKVVHKLVVLPACLLNSVGETIRQNQLAVLSVHMVQKVDMEECMSQILRILRRNIGHLLQIVKCTLLKRNSVVLIQIHQLRAHPHRCLPRCQAKMTVWLLQNLSRYQVSRRLAHLFIGVINLNSHIPFLLYVYNI